jgi:uncharacterized protein YfdQ (DUF2303 family)
MIIDKEYESEVHVQCCSELIRTLELIQESSHPTWTTVLTLAITASQINLLHINDNI